MPQLSESEEAWYCFQALTKKEHIAAEMIRTTMSLEVLCPRIKYAKVTQRGKVQFVEPLFPGYLFVRGDLKEYYRLIRATNGIRDVVMYGDRVPRVPESFIEELRKRLNEHDTREFREPDLEPGQRVHITSGPFARWEAIVAGKVRARNRVKLLLDFLGRQVEVSANVDEVISQVDSPARLLWNE